MLTHSHYLLNGHVRVTYGPCSRTKTRIVITDDIETIIVDVPIDVEWLFKDYANNTVDVQLPEEDA